MLWHGWFNVNFIRAKMNKILFDYFIIHFACIRSLHDAMFRTELIVLIESLYIETHTTQIANFIQA